MSYKKGGIMIVLSSPSGAGKTTLVKKISSEKDYFVSISHTTRKPRQNEINGKDYNFVSKSDFQKLIGQNQFLEYAEVFNNFYGTSKETVIEELKKGTNVLFDIDWQGSEQIKTKKIGFPLITFFILPPSKEELFQRLSNREMKDKLVVEERMKQFEKDMLHWKDYDFVVINDNLETCYKQIVDLIDSKINNRENNYNQILIEKHIKLLT